MLSIVFKKRVFNYLDIQFKYVFDIFSIIMAFFLGRFIIYDFFNPFAVAYLTIFINSSFKFYLITFFALIGLFSRLSGIFFLKYLVIILNMILLRFILNNKPILKNFYAKILAVFFINFVSSFVLIFNNNFSLFFFIVAFIESILVFCLSLVFERSINIIKISLKTPFLSNEDIVAVSILLSAVISGSHGIYIGNVYLSIFLIILVSMINSYRSGSSIGAAFALIISFVYYITAGADIKYIVIISISAAFAGTANKFGKIAVLLLFFSSLLILNVLINQNDAYILFSFIWAGIIFILIPDRFWDARSIVEINKNKYIDKLKDVVNTNIINISNNFEAINKLFIDVKDKKIGLNQDDLSKIVDDLVIKVCDNCPNKSYCWLENFYSSYEQTLDLIEHICNGSFNKEQIIQNPFLNNCINTDKFILNLHVIYEVHKNYISFENKLLDNKLLISNQFKNISDLLLKLSDNVELSINFKTELEEKILIKLNKKGIDVDSVVVVENKEGRYEVITKSKAILDKQNIMAMISYISKIINKNMRLGCETADYFSKVVKRVFIESEKYELNTFVAQKSKNGDVSGDCYSCMELKYGKYMLVLSDGMGFGKIAKKESETTIELLEDFMSTGIDTDVAIKIINSAMVLKNTEDNFSTLDICIVDLYTGFCEFIKIGASTTFLIRDNSVKLIKSSSLPMGIVNKLDLELSSKKLRKNDIILMLTDGVLDNLDGYEDKENVIRNKLKNMELKDPSHIANAILEESISSNDIKDDMTVLVTKIMLK